MTNITRNGKTFEEIGEDLISQADQSLKTIQNVLKLVLNGENQDLNEIIKNLYIEHKDEFGNDYKLFNKHIVNGLKEYIEFSEYFSKNGIKTKKDEQMSLRVGIFEEIYSEILYFGQNNRVIGRSAQLSEITRKKILDKLN